MTVHPTDDPITTVALRQADRTVVLAQRLVSWITHTHELEEEIALANIGVDLLGQARALYSAVAEREGTGLTEDDYAYHRDDWQFRNPLLVEQANGDFAHTMVRQFLHDAYATELWNGLLTSTDERLAAIAGKAVKETAYHLRHSGTWVVRLGDGTPESHDRAQDALDRLWRFTGELFESDDVVAGLVATGVVPDPEDLRRRWDATVDRVLGQATLVPPADVVMATGGWSGHHGEALSRLLGEMQVLQRTHPGASW
ncbi:1,2-phenylacetyl-CoA epoxidase subunit PaaC [Pseudonocardia endophytica]|uniref:Ring-1,2-phenylacetyl-CoA epoxidase subunit PaaC n=1 Tax=Pseudonocardia endophytica TaxID=401976 RepID=A0A4R1HXR1_PSEEN|nr:1,2-phenylacetyl-CoA epoxidase subunit PaaC [Pseudonocardia endophytica]TCK26303.1 ring-1,2-phenylacetyl-CoA epoxidase subunit PaaC [Pseudonocardia endophytica]